MLILVSVAALFINSFNLHQLREAFINSVNKFSNSTNVVTNDSNVQFIQLTNVLKTTKIRKILSEKVANKTLQKLLTTKKKTVLKKKKSFPECTYNNNEFDERIMRKSKDEQAKGFFKEKDFRNNINLKPLKFVEIEDNLLNLSINVIKGGKSYTEFNYNCSTGNKKYRKIAFIIPYRNRLKNLKGKLNFFLQN